MWKQGNVCFQKGKQVLHKSNGKRIGKENPRDGKIHVLVWRNKTWIRHCDGGKSGKTGNVKEFIGNIVNDDTLLTCEVCKTNWEWSPKNA